MEIKTMRQKKRTFETCGPVDPSRNYVVPRQKEIAELVEKIKQGRYIVIFAPRQTGKTTFFRWALDALEAEDKSYFPIQLDFEEYKNISVSAFYGYFHQDICKEIVHNFQSSKSKTAPSDTLRQFLENSSITDHVSMRAFFEQLSGYLKNQRVVIIIDEFDGIPTATVSDFLYSLRRIYLSKTPQRCPYCVGIIGVKNITQLNYDRSISPFNIQDDFALPNFTVSQVRELLGQYTGEFGQAIAENVIDNLHQQTAGQPFLVNRIAQILTEEMDIHETIALSHFEKAHKQILNERNVNISHLTTNIRQNPQFESVLMRIAFKELVVPFNLDNEFISELFTYGVIVPDSDGNCRIMNPIYQYRIVRTFQPFFNGLEQKYLPDDTEDGFFDYLAPGGQIDMRQLLANFRNFIARAGYRILQVPDTPQEFIGQYLLFAYLDTFVRQVRGFMYVEVRTGRGRMDLIILHKGEKYIVETKIWEGKIRFSAGKRQLAKYLKLEGASEGYYVVFDHRLKPQAVEDVDQIEGLVIVSYTIPVVQERPSDM
jgi:hypothetical protein